MNSQKYNIVIFLLLLPWLCSCGQPGNGNDYEQLPLKKALSQVEERFQVSISAPDSLVADLETTTSNWREASSAEQSLVALIQPHHLMFKETETGSYQVTSFETGRRPVEEGRAQLQYLSHLYHDRPSWENRKKTLRQCMLEALELSSLPSKPDSEPIVTNRRTMNGYTVENVALETLPGLFVTGSLYRPQNIIEEGVPVVLSPNGHFNNGRYRPDQQHRMATLARMGAMAFSYDLFGWGESQLQVGTEAHRTPLAMTIQILNGMRLLDFLTGLEHADSSRVGITGGSGGGSQTMLLTALDERIDVSVPVVMLSSYFNGGCPCESGRPVHMCGGGTNNVEVAAMAAPRPQLVISDGGDWTAHVPELAFPYLQKIYDYYEKQAQIQNVHLPDEGHDYGRSKREAMYRFMADHLELNLNAVKNVEGEIDESATVIEEESSLYVFGNEKDKLPDRFIRDFETLQQNIDW